MSSYNAEVQRAYYLANREKRPRQAREYYLANKEKALAYRKQWAKDNPDRTSEYSRNAARRFVAMRDSVAERQGNLCPCGEPLGDDKVLDHDHRCCNKTVRSSCRKCDRAVMHSICNLIISNVGEDSQRLRNLADYLDREHERLRAEDAA